MAEAPLVARVVRWAMLQRRLGVVVSDEVLALLVVLADRYNPSWDSARPGNRTLSLDAGVRSKTTIRERLRKAARLGAIAVTPGRGRGRATVVRFTDAVWSAPQLDVLAEMDAQKRVSSSCPFSEGEEAEKGQPGTLKGSDREPKRASSFCPPTVTYREEPREASSSNEARVSPSAPTATQTDNGNGAVTDNGRRRRPRHGPWLMRAWPAMPRYQKLRTEEWDERMELLRRQQTEIQAEGESTAGGGV